MEISSKYNPQEVEEKWYKFWMDRGYFTPQIDRNKKPFVIIMPPPNVTGELHVGHALTATILVRRALAAPGEARFFLEDDLRFLHNPFLLRGMEAAVDRFASAVKASEPIYLFGDRDVDGVTATVLLVEALKELGAEVHWTLPEGEEGYGLSTRAVEEAAGQGTGLIITVDCGIANRAEIELAAGLGIETIVATVSSLNAESLRFHLARGFVEQGRLVGIGSRGGQRFDVVYLQKML